MQLVNIGFGNFVSAGRIIAIVAPESAPIKRLIQDARDNFKLIDATYGRKKRAVIITDSGHVLLTSVQPETLYHRFDNDTAAEPVIYEDDDEDVDFPSEDDHE